MSVSPAIIARRLLRLLPRLAWGLLVAVHVPVLAEIIGGLVATPSLGGFAALAGVLGTVAVFLLKLIDMPILRLPTRRHAFVAFCLVTAIVHHEALSTAPPEVALLPATTVAVGLAASRRSGSGGPRFVERLHDLLVATVGERLATPMLVPGRVLTPVTHGPIRTAPSACVPRGPPA